MEKRERLPIETFDMPVQDIRRGYCSAVYFWREKRILEKLNYDKKVTMQVFQKNDAVLCGIDEAIAVLKLCSGYYSEPERAFSLFDEYKKQERLIRELYVRQYFLRRDNSGWENALRRKTELEIELSVLWVDKSAELDIRALNDRDRISPWETVMTIEGLPQILPILNRFIWESLPGARW